VQLTLYKSDNKNKCRLWTVEQVDDQFRVTAGLRTGKLTTSKWTKVKGKNKGRSNATTAAEQAEAEAKALWTKKQDKGYFATEELAMANKPMEVMLAYNYKDYASELVYPLYCQPKLDGIRCFITKDGLFTRNRKPINLPYIWDSVKHIFAQYPTLIIDSELYTHLLHENFNRIVSLVRKKQPTAEEQEEAKKLELSLHVFDVIPDKSSTMVFSARNAFLRQLLANVPNVVIVRTDKVDTVADLDRLYKEYRDLGYEGQMVRQDAAYQFKRTNVLLKRKEFIDEEFLITGFKEGVGNRSGTIGYFIMQTKDKKEFHSNVKGDMTLLRQLWKDREKYVGRQATIKFFSYTPDGIPRFPYIIKFDRAVYE
jgi:ATP-dependent DNA ligase